jgi:O-antigen/teichoic acid export membrane protein
MGQVATQAGLGAAGLGAPGLLIGDAVGRVAGAGSLALLALRERPGGPARAPIATVARRYRRFPLLTTWAGLLTIGSLQLPSLLFASGFGAAAAGLYALSYKVLLLPTMLVAQAVGQVFLARAAPLAREPERLRDLTERTALVLLALGLPLFGAVGLGGPRLFAVTLGTQWEPAGRYAQYLAPWFVLWLVSTPLSGLFNIREWQGWSLAFSALEFALRLGALIVGSRRGSPILAVALLSASGVLIALTSLTRFLHAGHSSLGRLAGPAGRLLALALICLLPAAIALHAGHERGAAALMLLAIGVYYLTLLRSEAASRILYPAAQAGAPGVSP